ncbi:MAG TPA: CYTH and CHAD domain-containing protein [Jatrophihabitans sp.]|nr:CYTH and CHAD domain-containing protein [Jatrophihabitans sp.]
MAAESYLERELKFDVPAGFALPDLAGVSPLVDRVDHSEQHLRNEYFDTDDHALRAAQMTLRRRTGGEDAGWQLKVPHPPAREEIRLALDGPLVPEELTELLLGVRRGQPVRPVALLETDRSVTRLLDADGHTLAEVADDSVRAAVPGATANVSSWREIEVELGTGDEQLLDQLAGLLRRHGAEPSASSSKLARALGDAERPEPAGPLAGYLVEQERALLAGDLALRRGDDSAVHKTRVGSRRFRSTLRIFGELLDPSAGQRLDEELRWYAGLLGEVRDRQVQRATLLAMVDELADTEVLGPVRARIEQTLNGEQAEHWAELQQALSGDRYLRLLDAVHEFVRTAPPDVPVRRLKKLMRKAERKVTKRLARAGRRGEPELLHRARKAAKRARYAGELVQPTGSGKAAEQAARNESLQDLLGDHQDSLVGLALLRRLGSAAGTTPGENGFTFGVLYQRRLQRAAELHEQAARLARKRS